MHEALTRVTDDLIAHPPTSVSPASVTFLVRRYLANGMTALHAAIEPALGAAVLACEHEADARVRVRWLGALSEASVLVADDTLAEFTREQLPNALDDLERLVRGVYEPGEGAVGHGVDGQVLLALSLVVAFDLSARLPYAMLAEELLQSTLRGTVGRPARHGAMSFPTRCQLVQLCCRLSALHRDPDYVARAVTAPGVHYERDAAAWLDQLTAPHSDALDVAEYGLALLDHFALSALPN